MHQQDSTSYIRYLEIIFYVRAHNRNPNQLIVYFAAVLGGRGVEGGGETNFISSAHIFPWAMELDVMRANRRLPERSKDVVSGTKCHTEDWHPLHHYCTHKYDVPLPILSEGNQCNITIGEDHVMYRVGNCGWKFHRVCVLPGIK